MRRFHRQAMAGAIVMAATGFAGSVAQAQMPNINLMPEVKTQTPEEKERDAIADKAYRESLRKIPNQAVNDPWGSVRSSDAAAAKSAPKAPKAVQAKRQTKTDGTTN